MDLIKVTAIFLKQLKLVYTLYLLAFPIFIITIIYIYIYIYIYIPTIKSGKRIGLSTFFS